MASTAAARAATLSPAARTRGACSQRPIVDRIPSSVIGAASFRRVRHGPRSAKFVATGSIDPVVERRSALGRRTLRPTISEVRQPFSERRVQNLPPRGPRTGLNLTEKVNYADDLAGSGDERFC